MIELFVGIALIAGCYYSGYIVSRYADMNRYRGDKSEQKQGSLTVRQEKRRLRLAKDPRLLRQIALLFKSFVLVLASFAAAVILWRMLQDSLSAFPYLAIVAMFAVWLGHIFFLEYLPRRLSRSGSATSDQEFSWFVVAVFWAFKPLVGFYRQSIRGGSGNSDVTEEEKEEIVERAIESLAEQAGIGEAIIEEEEKEMIGHIFELDQTVVREIMIPRTQITAIELGSSLSEIKTLVKEDGYSRFPVYSDTIDSILGILYVKDLFSAQSPAESEFDLSRYLRKPFVVPESKIISELLREFMSRKVHIAIVVDEYGGITGLVTLEDILEEIVGEIRDEHDFEEDDIRQLADGSYCVNAAMLLEDLQEFFQTEYDQGEYDSVGGLIYDLVGSVPAQGAIVKWHDFEFEIDKVEGQRITGIKVCRQNVQGTDTPPV